MRSMSSPDLEETFSPTNWIETNFFRRECVRFVRSLRDPLKCACGRTAVDHPIFAVIPVDATEKVETGNGTASPRQNPNQNERRGSENNLAPNNGTEARLSGKWSPSKNTIRYPTNAYGCIEFQGGPHPSKAQYIRLTNDSSAEAVFELFLAEWGLEPPKLLITIHGGKQNFDLNPKLKKVFKRGLLRAAKTTGAWLFTAGTNNGVTRHVGEALVTEKSPRLKRGRVVSIGVAPWGVIDGRGILEKKNEDIPYHSIAAPRSKLAVLNNRHSHFLLVDNGTIGRYGCEVVFRRKLERYITQLRLDTHQVCCIPMVCVVVEGGPNTIRTVLEYVTDDPPVPVVICDGSGRAADVLAYAYRYSGEDESGNLVLRGKDYLIELIQGAFSVPRHAAERLMFETLECVRRRDLITIFSVARNDHQDDAERPTFRPVPEPAKELDEALLGALLKSPDLPVAKQLALVLSWDRVDIARSQLFVYGQEWPPGCLEEAMMNALILNRLEFVKLLLENGVSMKEFLTIQRLEELYNTREGPSNTLRYIVADVRPSISEDYWFTLVDIGLVLNKLMGGAFRSSYCRRKFRHLYSQATASRASDFKRHSAAATAIKRSGLLVRNASALFFSSPPNDSRGTNHKKMSIGSNDTKGNSTFLDDPVFDYPFHDLMIWAVLMKRQDMALLMWQHGEEAVPKALVAVKLYKAMAYEAKDDDLELEVYEELKKHAKDFERRALELMDYCYHQNRDLTQQLLTVELVAFSRMTCLSLAYIAGHYEFLSHPCPQMLLADLWLGGLRMRKSINVKVIFGLACPLYLLWLDFKTVEELQLQPQTEEEYEDQFSDRSSVTSSGSDSSLNSKSSTGSEVSQRIFRRPRLPTAWRDQDMELSQPKTRLLSDTSAQSRPVSPLQDRKPEGRTSPLLPNGSATAMGGSVEEGKKVKRSLWRGGAQSEAVQQFISSLPSDGRSRLHSASCFNSLHQEPGSKPLSHLHQTPVFRWPKGRQRELSNRQKLHEFYAAPVTKFWGHAMAYVVFLLVYTYMVLVRLPPDMYWPEWFVIAYVVAFGFQKISELLNLEPHHLVHKMALFFTNFWNICDTFAVLFFLLGVLLRASGLVAGRVIYCTVIMYWYVRILDFLTVNKWLGPFVTMIGRMVIKILYFVVLLGVVMLSFGVARRSILFPDEPPDWYSLREVFFQPYFMLYGEVFAPDISPPCGPDEEVPCVPGRWITPIAMTAYLFIANILLINLLIAVFNNIFEETNSISKQLWMFQRYSVVMQYEQKPVLPPPFIVISHFSQMIKFFIRKYKGIEKKYSQGLKLFLDRQDLERVHDFEEECMDVYCEEVARKQQQSADERIKVTWENVERISQRVNDLSEKQNADLSLAHNMDVRLTRIENMMDTAMDLLASMHQRTRARTSASVPQEEHEEQEEQPEQQHQDHLHPDLFPRSRLGSRASRKGSVRVDRMREEIVVPASMRQDSTKSEASGRKPRESGQSAQMLFRRESSQHSRRPSSPNGQQSPPAEQQSRRDSVSRRRGGRAGVKPEAGGVVRLPPLVRVVHEDDVFSHGRLGHAFIPNIRSEERERLFSKESSVEPPVLEEEEEEEEDEEGAVGLEQKVSPTISSGHGRTMDWVDEMYPPGMDPFSMAFGSTVNSVDYCPARGLHPAIQVIPPTPPVFFGPLSQEYPGVGEDRFIGLGRQRSNSHLRRPSESAPPLPAAEGILLENEALRQAESSHYHMMGTVIKRRLRGVSECQPVEDNDESPADMSHGDIDDTGSDDDPADLCRLLRQAEVLRKISASSRLGPPNYPHGRSMQNLESSSAELPGSARSSRSRTKSSISLPSLHDARTRFIV